MRDGRWQVRPILIRDAPAGIRRCGVLEAVLRNESDGGAIALLYGLQNELEAACSAQGRLGPGVGALAGRLVDAFKRESAGAKTLRRAESILLDLQRVDMSRRAGDGKHLQLLISSRDAARMIVADYRRSGGFA
jgi:hypothetical protein